MKVQHGLFIVAGFFLITACACLLAAFKQPEDGVRIPVHGRDGKMGYIDGKGRMAISPRWDSASPFGTVNHAMVSATRDVSKIEKWFRLWKPGWGRFGMLAEGDFKIDRFGNTERLGYSKFSPLFRDAGLDLQGAEPVVSEGMTLVERGPEFRWMLQDGSPAFAGSWQRALDFKRGDPAAVFKDGRWGFINRKGENVISYDWDETLGFDGNGRACVAINKTWGVIDRDGRLVIPLLFQSLSGFDKAGMCQARMASGCGFIDRDGKIVIPFRYRNAEPFDRFDMAKIEMANRDGKIRRGWIDRSGKCVVQPRYETKEPMWASNFAGCELLPVIDSGMPGLIDRTGRSVIASAHGELRWIEDPVAPGSCWITTCPYRNKESPDLRPPFEPACYDQTGKLIWRGSVLTSPQMFAVGAAIAGVISALVFVAGRRFNRKAKAMKT